MPRTLIKDVPPNEFIEGVFAINNCQLGQTRNGKPYLKCLLSDRSAKVPGRMWNANEQLFQQLPTDGFVRIEGHTQPYQGQLQIIVEKIEAADPTDDDLLDLLPSTNKDIFQLFDDVKTHLAGLEHAGLKALAQSYLDDAELMRRFQRAPAAMSLHHAYLGGLIEHTANLLDLADRICPLYPEINGDLVKLGLFLHDLGKCEELHWERGFGYTEDGLLVGHIARGILRLQEKVNALADAGPTLPETLVRVLHHIILSHHQTPEFGALKTPSTPEAWAVSLIDNLDAKLNMAIAATRSESAQTAADADADFTDRIWSLNNTRMFKPDPTKTA